MQEDRKVTGGEIEGLVVKERGVVVLCQSLEEFNCTACWGCGWSPQPSCKSWWSWYPCLSEREYTTRRTHVKSRKIQMKVFFKKRKEKKIDLNKNRQQHATRFVYTNTSHTHTQTQIEKDVLVFRCFDPRGVFHALSQRYENRNCHVTFRRKQRRSVYFLIM